MRHSSPPNAAWTEFIRDEDAIGSAEHDEVTAPPREAREAASKVPPRCTADLAALLHIWWDEYSPTLTKDDFDLADEAHDPLPMFIPLIWRTATGLDGWPRQIVSTSYGLP